MKATLKVGLASLAMVFASHANALIIDGFGARDGSDVVISIFNTATSQSALIDTDLDTQVLANSPSLFTFTDAAVTSFLSTGQASDFVFSVFGIMTNNQSSTFTDFGTVTTKVGGGNGPLGFSALGSAVSTIAGDISGANFDPNFSSVDVATGLTSGGAFHDNVTSNAQGNHSWNIEAALDTFVEFAWTRVNPMTGATFTDIVGYWDINSTTGQIRFDTQPATVVPVPAAVWLFGSGLLGLVGVARRRTV
jgi:hypothetical protein